MVEYGEENARAADLVRRISAGDRRAEATLVSLFDGRLAAKLQQHASDPETLAELRQEVWIRIIVSTRRGEVGDPERVYGFILGTARNVVREYFKSVSRTRRESPDELAMIPDPAATVERLLDEEQAARHLRACLEEMTGRDREILLRHYMRGDPKDVTCRLLGLTSLNYNNVLHRARRRLADLLEQDGEEVKTAPLPEKHLGYGAG